MDIENITVITACAGLPTVYLLVWVYGAEDL